MTSTHLTAQLRKARLMVRTSDSAATKQYWLERAAAIEKHLARRLDGFETMRPIRAAWDQLPGNV